MRLVSLADANQEIGAPGIGFPGMTISVVCRVWARRCTLRWMRVLAVRSLVAVLVVSVGLVMGACEKPDASHTTSPSARLLLGLTTGRVLYHIPELPPEPVVPPAGWAYELGNARYEKLENGTHAILVVGQVTAKIGPDVEIWLADKDETVAKWFGGSSHGYDGVICWQQKLEAGGQALVLKPGVQYTLTVAFRDPGDGGIVLARRVDVRGNVPSISGAEPEEDSEVFRDLLGCPRGM